MKKLFISETGVVSVYLIIILGAIFFFNAVLIDYARVMAAKRETESITKASLRSVLAAYDTELLKKYGLFGLSNENETELFQEAVNLNLDKSETAFNFIDLSLEANSISVKTEQQLAYHQVFERQILEDMKYQAPINITEELIEQFSSFSLLLEEGADTSETLKEVTDLYEERQKLLKEALGYQEKSADIIKESNNINEIEEIVNGYDNYLRNLEEYKRLSKGKADENNQEMLNKLRAEINSYLRKANNIEKINDSYNNNKHQYYLKVAEEKLLAAKKVNEEIKKTADNAKKGSTDNADINSLREITNNLDSVVLEDSYFDAIQNSIERQAVLYDEIADKVNMLTKEINSAVDVPSEGAKAKLNSRFKELKAAESEYKQHFVEKNNQIAKSQKELKKQEQELDEKVEKNEEDAGLNINALKKLFDTMEQIKAENADLKLVNQYSSEYYTFNSKDSADNNEKDSGKTADETDKDPDALATDSMTEFSNLLSSLNNMLIDLRDVLYVNEYAYSKFNYFDPTILKETISFNDSTGSSGNRVYSSIGIDSNKLIEILSISNQEVEYIIYGSDNLSGNVALALRDIFLIRLAVRTLEGFLDKKVRALGHPLAILAGAVAYGASHATNDILRIIDGKDVEFSSLTKQISFNYQDYLRFLLFLHNDHKGKLSRMQGLIQFNTNKDLKKVPTYVETNYSTSLDLWFLPGVIKGLSLSGILDGKVEGNKYIIPRNAALAY